jgi:hypothetical protein
MQIFVSHKGKSYGPYTIQEYTTCLNNNSFDRNAAICVDGKNWVVPSSVLPTSNASMDDSEKNKSPIKSRRIKFIFLGVYLAFCIFIYLVTGFETIVAILACAFFLVPFLLFKMIKFAANSVANYKSPAQVLSENASAWVVGIKQSRSLPSVFTNIILKKSEVAYFNESSKLHETRAVRHHQSGFAGFRVMKGVYVGGSKGKSTSTQEWTHIDDGTLVVTNKRIVFDGFSQNRSFDLKKVLSVSQGTDALEVSIEGRQKSVVFNCSNSIICATIIQICAQTENPSDLSNINLDIQINEPK